MKDTKDIGTDLKDSGILYELNNEERTKLKNILLQTYKDFSEFCDKNGLVYMMGGGSALGSIRHSGFIPWDDDLDLMMPRDDYEKMKNLFNEGMPACYCLQIPNSKNHKASNLFAKIVRKNTKLIDLYNYKTDFEQGIAIDVFPIDRVPNNSFLRKIKGFFSNAIAYTAVSRYIYKYRHEALKDFFCSSKEGTENYNRRLVLGFLASGLSCSTWYNMYDKFVQNNNQKAKCYTIGTGRKHYMGEMLPKEIFVPVTDNVFEGLKAKLPHDTDSYLKNLYRDYMSIPPENKRERHYFLSFEDCNL